MTRKIALITGASSGIGYELAVLLAADGNDTVLVARSRDKLEQLAQRLQRDYGRQATVMTQDLARPGSAEELFSDLVSQGIEVDVLVNNAGFTVYGPFAQTPLDAELELMQLNMVSLTHLTKRLLPGMLRRGSGRILNVASTAAFQPGPLMAVYYASKAYVLSFSEALAEELHGSGVAVTALCPGPTRSGFAGRAAATDIRLFRGPTMDPRVVAAAGYAGLMRGQRVVVPGARNRLLALAARFAPRPMVMRLVRRMQETPRTGRLP